MCKRNCIYRGKLSSGIGCCNWHASEHDGIQKTTRTGAIMEMLGKNKADEEVRELLRGECCPLYVWDGKGRKSETKDPKEVDQEKKAAKLPNIRPEESERIEEEFLKGYSDREIHYRTNIPEYKVAYWRKERGLESNFKRGRSFDQERAMELYLAGRYDDEIATALQTSVHTVYSWRSRNHLTINYKVKRVTDEEKALRTKLYMNGATDGEIARATGRTRNQIRHWRKRNELPKNDAWAGMHIDEKEFRRLYKLGYNDVHIAELTGHSKESVGKWRARNGLPVNKEYRKRKPYRKRRSRTEDGTNE